MKLAIMQPYLFPYIGYFQLMSAVDVFVFYDNAQYMKGGWINRNRYLNVERPQWFTLPLVSENYKIPINKRTYLSYESKWKEIIKTLRHVYRKAPNYQEIYALINESAGNDISNVAEINCILLARIAQRLNLKCEFKMASSLLSREEDSGQNYVLSISKALGATTYINMIGGRELYNKKTFSEKKILLQLLEPTTPRYNQFNKQFTAALSIIDVMMFVSPEEIQKQIMAFTIIHP
jgi:hypothetical protein